MTRWLIGVCLLPTLTLGCPEIPTPDGTTYIVQDELPGIWTGNIGTSRIFMQFDADRGTFENINSLYPQITMRGNYATGGDTANCLSPNDGRDYVCERIEFDQVIYEDWNGDLIFNDMPPAAPLYGLMTQDFGPEYLTVQDAGVCPNPCGEGVFFKNADSVMPVNDGDALNLQNFEIELSNPAAHAFSENQPVACRFTQANAGSEGLRYHSFGKVATDGTGSVESFINDTLFVGEGPISSAICKPILPDAGYTYVVPMLTSGAIAVSDREETLMVQETSDGSMGGTLTLEWLPTLSGIDVSWDGQRPVVDVPAMPAGGVTLRVTLNFLPQNCTPNKAETLTQSVDGSSITLIGEEVGKMHSDEQVVLDVVVFDAAGVPLAGRALPCQVGELCSL